MNRSVAGAPEAAGRGDRGHDREHQSEHERDQDNAQEPQDPEVAQIQHEIEQTRAEMSETIDALQDRLDPERLSEQAKETALDVTEQAKDKAIEVTQLAIEHAKDAVRELADDATSALRAATIGKVENMVTTTRENASSLRSTIIDTVRENPIPAALVGIGVGWLFMNGSSNSGGASRTSRDQKDPQGYGSYGARRSGSSSAYRGQVYSGAAGAGYRRDEAAGGVSGAVAGVKDAASGIAESASEAAARTKDTVQDTAGIVGDKAQDLAGWTTAAAGELMDRVEYRASRVEDKFQGMLQRNPLAIGAVALGLGAVVGLALPGTHQEDELMGDLRDDVMDRAQDLARDATEKVKSVAGEAQRAAKDEAREQHLTQ